MIACFKDNWVIKTSVQFSALTMWLKLYLRLSLNYDLCFDVYKICIMHVKNLMIATKQNFPMYVLTIDNL